MDPTDDKREELDDIEEEPIVDAKLTPDERQDLSDTLENLITVGCAHRHADWRRNEWRKRKHHQQQEQENENGGESHQQVLDLFAEDVRLYGQDGIRADGIPADPWPRKRTRWAKQHQEIKNDAWEMEYGDEIPADDFCRWKRSQESTMDASSSVRPDEESITTTENLDHIPRDLLLRCWDRAVGVASSTVELDTTSILSNTKDHPPEQSTPPTSRSATSAQSKCKSFGIELPNQAPFVCLNCHVEFDSIERLREHFYGNEHRGCAWTLIDAAQRAFVDRILQSEVKRQTRQILELILRKSKQPDTNNKQVFDWEHVMQVLQRTLDISIEQKPVLKQPKVQDTLELEVNVPPLPLNELVMKAISSRLIDRYAKVPK